MPGAMSTRDHYLAQCRAREGEEQRRQSEKRILAEKALSGKAVWENKTAATIEAKLLEDRVKDLKSRFRSGLESRRLRLSALLSREEGQYKGEIMSSFETSEQRMARLKEKAMELRDRREKERLEFVAKAREEQWRLTCDDLRTRDTKIIAKEINLVDRRKQLEFADRLKEKEKEMDAKFTIMYEQNRLDRIAVEEKKIALREALNLEVKKMLDSQMVERQEIMQEETQDRIDEAARLKALWVEDERRQIEQEKAHREHAASERSRVAKFNKDQKYVKDEIKRKENDFEMKLLSDALQREAEDDARDRAEAEARKQSMLEYQRHLKAQLIKEATDNSALEELRKSQMEAEWKKREDQWQREADARSNLMRQVHSERQLQLKLKSERITTQREADKKYAEESAIKSIDDDLAEQNKMAKLSADRRAHQSDIVSQIDRKAAMAERIKQQEYAEFMFMKRAEERYQDALEKLLASGREERSFARKKNDW